MGDHLPFRVEYAKTGRASCKACKKSIEKDSLRLAKVVQSPFHDGVLTNWFHSDCFFSKASPKTIGDIGNFDNIRWDDQQVIKAKVEGGGSIPVETGGKGRKRPSPAAFKDFKIEYAKSNRSTCLDCETGIVKGQVRISKKDYDSEHGAKFGGIDRWHHLECFAQTRDTLQFFASGNCLPGFDTLTKDDKASVKKLLPEVKNADLPPSAKKIKSEPVDSKEEKLMKNQNVKMHKLRDQLSVLTKKELILLLEKNSQYIPQGESNLLDVLSDAMTFGALSHCPKCEGQLKFRSGIGYKCRGDLTVWTKCEEIIENPKRRKFIIPSDLKECYEFLEKYKPKVEQRIFQKNVSTASTSSIKKEDTTDSGPKINRGLMPLRGMQFVFIGQSVKDKETLKAEIMKLGGKVSSKAHENVTAFIATENTIKKNSSNVNYARNWNIQIVSEDFVDAAKNCKDVISLINEKNICDWGSDPSTRIQIPVSKSSSHKSMYEVSGSKVKLQVKGGGAVDPNSGLSDVAHVYQSDDNNYTVTLGITDIQAKKNSFYKLQILKHDKQNKFWLYRNWGRIGTTIGGEKLENLELSECINKFETLYEEKSGNAWRNRKSFVKVPHMMYPLDIDHGLDDSNVGNMESDIKSNLKKPVQDLISLIFDVKLMKKIMAEYEIDTEKMPLGKLSKNQLQQAYSVLTELQKIIQHDNPERMLLVDASNRFYTLVPHNFGIADPPILDSEDAIKAKCEMVDALIEMEIAYSLLSVPTDKEKNPLDAHYQQLNTEIDVLDKSSEQFKIIQQYTKNTHAATHRYYNLDIEDVFVIKRSGEADRFKPFKKLPNRKLLWHGSRTTNYAGILSQGLRIAPPEAPVTGYMFGKGIYFADMVSKSANYCCTNRSNSTGLLLLCEVACGKMYERTQAEFIEKLPKGYHSTLGMGQTYPDPAQAFVTDDKVEIPHGLPVNRDDNINCNLLYNEYIVYDVAQVKAQYLVRMKFNHKL